MTRAIPPILLVLASALSAQEVDPQESRRLSAEAVRLYEEGKSKEAMALFTRAVELDPKSAEALLHRAKHHEYLGERSEALADYQRAVELDPRGLAAPWYRGRLRLALGEAADAIADFDRMLTLEPRLTCVYLWLGRAYELKGEPLEAEKCFRVAADYEGDDPVGNSCMGEALLCLGDARGAEAAWRKALELEPGCDSALYFRAKHKFDSRRLEEARVDLQMSRPGSEEPGDIRVFQYHVLWGLEKGEELPEVLMAARQWDRSRVLRDRDAALSEETRKDPVKVVQQLTEILRRDPRYLEARYMRGVYRRQAHDEDGALADLDAVLSFAPHHTQVLMERARLHREMGAQEKALKDLGEVIRVDPRSWEAFAVRGLVQERRGRDDLAVEDLEEALELAPESWEGRAEVQEHLDAARKRLPTK